MKIIGKRILVKKERLDVGGLKLQPETEEDGAKNKGVIMEVGQIGLLPRLLGIKKGAKVYFKRFFVANNSQDPSDRPVFVEVEDIVAIEKTPE